MVGAIGATNMIWLPTLIALVLGSVKAYAAHQSAGSGGNFFARQSFFNENEQDQRLGCGRWLGAFICSVGPDIAAVSLTINNPDNDAFNTLFTQLGQSNAGPVFKAGIGFLVGGRIADCFPARRNEVTRVDTTSLLNGTGSP